MAGLVGILTLRRIMTTDRKPDWVAGDGGQWNFPVPDIRSPTGAILYPALVTQEFKPGRHHGVDVMFRKKPGDDAKYPSGVVDPGGAMANGKYFAPVGIPVLAARPGRVWSITHAATGIIVVLDHGTPWATAYFHLASTPLPPHVGGKRVDGKEPVAVAAGQVIGTMGHNPNKDPRAGVVDAEKLRHLHFETWYRGAGNSAAVDPTAVMSGWKRHGWTQK